jgi:hypothetical protein
LSISVTDEALVSIIGNGVGAHFAVGYAREMVDGFEVIFF